MWNRKSSFKGFELGSHKPVVSYIYMFNHRIKLNWHLKQYCLQYENNFNMKSNIYICIIGFFHFSFDSSSSNLKEFVCILFAFVVLYKLTFVILVYLIYCIYTTIVLLLIMFNRFTFMFRTFSYHKKTIIDVKCDIMKGKVNLFTIEIISYCMHIYAWSSYSIPLHACLHLILYFRKNLFSVWKVWIHTYITWVKETSFFCQGNNWVYLHVP